MKFLILSCNTGGGHNSAALALKEQADQMGNEAVVLDYLTMAGKGVSRTVGDTYINIVKHVPVLFGVIYKIGMAVSRLFDRSPVYFANSFMAKYLAEYMRENDFDAVLMPHLYPAETLSYMKRKGMKVPFLVYVSTDYTLIPFVEETDCDIYTIPHREQKKEAVERGIPEEKIRVTGIPVSESFRERRAKEESRRLLNLPKEGRIALILGGSMGAGHPGRLTALLHQMTGKKDRIVVVCGNNRREYKKLRRLFGRSKRVSIIGKTDRMADYLYASDIVFSKPGGLSCTEIAVAGAPFVITTPIPGCETENRNFFCKKHMAVSAKTLIGQATVGIRLLNSTNAQRKMHAAQMLEINPHAAQEIIRAALAGCGERMD